MKQYFLSTDTFFTTPKSSVTTWKYTRKARNEDYQSDPTRNSYSEKE